MHPVSCTNTHDITGLKNWISWEQNITYLQNKIFLTCVSDNTFWEVIIFKGGDIQNFEEGGKILYERNYHFMGGLDNPLKTIAGIYWM